MTYIDWGAIVLVGLSALTGLWRGAVKELLALLSWVGAFLAARAYSGALGGFLPGGWGSGPAARPIAFLLILVGALILFRLLTSAVVALLRLAGLGLPDRILGVLFGLLRGVLVLVALTILCQLTPLRKDPQWRDAALRAPLEAAAQALKAQLPRLEGAWKSR